MPNVLYDEKIFDDFSQKFLTKYVKNIIRTFLFARSKAIDLENISDDERTLFQDLAFSTLILLEDFGGTDISGQKYVVHTMLATSPTDPEDLIATADRTRLHGGVSMEIVDAAIEELKMEEA